MKFASLIAMISKAALHAMPEFTSGRDVSVTPKNPTPKNPTKAGKVGRSVASDRRRAQKKINVMRNRLAHR